MNHPRSPAPSLARGTAVMTNGMEGDLTPTSFFTASRFRPSHGSAADLTGTELGQDGSRGR